MKPSDLTLYITVNCYAKFGILFMDKLLLWAKNLFGEHHPVRRPVIYVLDVLMWLFNTPVSGHWCFELTVITSVSHVLGLRITKSLSNVLMWNSVRPYIRSVGGLLNLFRSVEVTLYYDCVMNCVFMWQFSMSVSVVLMWQFSMSVSDVVMWRFITFVSGALMLRKTTSVSGALMWRVTTSVSVVLMWQITTSVLCALMLRRSTSVSGALLWQITTSASVVLMWQITTSVLGALMTQFSTSVWVCWCDGLLHLCQVCWCDGLLHLCWVCLCDGLLCLCDVHWCDGLLHLCQMRWCDYNYIRARCVDVTDYYLCVRWVDVTITTSVAGFLMWQITMMITLVSGVWMWHFSTSVSGFWIWQFRLAFLNKCGGSSHLTLHVWRSA